MEALSTGGGGAGLVGLCGVGVATVIFAVVFLVFRMSPGPNYEEVFRKQREQLLAMDEPKQKKKEKVSKKARDKKEKKDRSEERSRDQVQAISVSASVSSLHDHVDFAEREQVKLVELDQPPMVQADKVLPAGRHPAKPILLRASLTSVLAEKSSHGDVAAGGDDQLPTTEASKSHSSHMVRCNSFRELKPMDEVELHRARRLTPSEERTPSSAKLSSAVIGSTSNNGQINEGAFSKSQTTFKGSSASPQKKQQQQLQNQAQQNAPLEKSAIQTNLSVSASIVAKKSNVSPVHESSTQPTRKERKIFSKRDIKEFINQIEQDELPTEVTEDIVQRMVDALLNHQNASKEWRSTRQDPMQVLKKNLAEKEEMANALSAQLHQTLVRNKDLREEVATWKTRFAQMQSSLPQIEAKAKENAMLTVSDAQRKQRIAEDQLHKAQVENDHLRGQMLHLKYLNDELNSTIRGREESLAAEKQELELAANAKIEQACAEANDLRKQLEQVHASMMKTITTEKHHWESRADQAVAEKAHLQQVLCETQSLLEQTRCELASANEAARQAQETTSLASSSKDRHVDEKLAELQDECDTLKKRNTQLHKKNWATVEAMTQAEKKYIDLRDSLSDSRQRRLRFLLDALPENERASFNHCIDEVDDELKFITEYVSRLRFYIKQLEETKVQVNTLKLENNDLEKKLREARETSKSLSLDTNKGTSVSTVEMLSKDEGLENELDDLREEVVRLRAENAHYTGSLKKTENMLQALERSVNSEERRWAEDRMRFEKERSEMSSAIRELEWKLKELQAQLVDTEAERNSIQGQLENSREDIVSGVNGTMRKTVTTR